jgi:hypothetical protein
VAGRLFIAPESRVKDLKYNVRNLFFAALRRMVFMTLVLSSAAAMAGESRFFTELSDIPLMPGLYELTGKTVVFDKPEGRIVESSAVSETENANQIKGFYDSILPPLGWVRQGDSYVRRDETLRLSLDSGPAFTVLKITVFPR